MANKPPFSSSRMNPPKPTPAPQADTAQPRRFQRPANATETPPAAQISAAPAPGAAPQMPAQTVPPGPANAEAPLPAAQIPTAETAMPDGPPPADPLSATPPGPDPAAPDQTPPVQTAPDPTSSGQPAADKTAPPAARDDSPPPDRPRKDKPPKGEKAAARKAEAAARKAATAARKKAEKAARQKAAAELAISSTPAPDPPTKGKGKSKEPALVVRTPPSSGKAKSSGKPAAAAKVVEVAPMAKRARMRRRHWGLVLSMLLLLAAPLAASGWYLWTRAVDQYASTVGFTVRQENGAGASDLLGGGLGAFVGGGGEGSDTDILYEFIQSQSLVAALDAEFGLRQMYAANWEQDPIFSLHPDASLEDMVDYWQRVLRISYDEGSRLIELRVQALNPDTAQALAQAIIDRSQVLINDLNAQAREDTMRYAQEDLTDAQERLREARADLIKFRTRTQLVDPETDLAGRMGVVNTLQQQLAEALIELDLLTQSTSDNDPRVTQARRRIEVIRGRIAQERLNVASGDDSTAGEDYPTLLAEYEALVADREFAEQSYLAALTALDVARADASRQSRYLATYVQPTLPQTAEYPQRWTLFGLTALFLLLSWSILALIYYSVRDSK